MWRVAIGMLVATSCWRGTTNRADEPAAPAEHGFVILDRAPADALELKVRAIRWACDVHHPRDVVTPDLRIPAGRPIKLVVWTPELPEAAPGLEVSLVGAPVKKAIAKDAPVEIVFRVDVPGTYHWKCPTITPPWREPEPGVEVSDLARAQQDPVKAITVLPAAEYEAMLAANDPEQPGNRVAIGRTLYEKKGCVACHTLDGTPRVGPSWKGIWGTSVRLADGSTRTVDAEYVKASLLHPQGFARPGFPPVMPSFEGQLREHEIAALVALIESLKAP
jgi:cytochrome c oxidase subunit 2